MNYVFHLCFLASCISTTLHTMQDSDPRMLTSSELIIQYLLDKYKIKSQDDAITWLTPEDIRNLDSGTPIKSKQKDDRFEILALLAGYKPIVHTTDGHLPGLYAKEPLLQTLYYRGDHDFKLLRAGYAEYSTCFSRSLPVQHLIFYDSKNDSSYRNALLAQLHEVEEQIRYEKKQFSNDTFYKQAYVEGKLLGYPIEAIRAFVRENWERAQWLGESWLAQQANKTNAQLQDEFERKYKEHGFETKYSVALSYEKQVASIFNQFYAY